jgi:hypothetical protein
MGQNLLPSAGLETISTHSPQQASFQHARHTPQYYSQNISDYSSQNLFQQSSQYPAQPVAQQSSLAKKPLNYDSEHRLQSSSRCASLNASEFLERLKTLSSKSPPAPTSDVTPSQSKFSMFSSMSDGQEEHGYTETIADRLTRKIVRSEFDRQGRLYLRYSEGPSFWMEERFDQLGRQISRTEVDRTTGRGKVLQAGPNGQPMITMIFYEKGSSRDAAVPTTPWPTAI